MKDGIQVMIIFKRGMEVYGYQTKVQIMMKIQV